MPSVSSGEMRKVLILGSTGSIGTQALKVISSSPELSVVGLAAGTGWEATVAALDTAISLRALRMHGDVPA